MKPVIPLFMLLLMSLVSCQNNRSNQQPNNNVPEALEENNSYEILSKRGYEDLLEKLYKDLAAKDSDLIKLEKMIAVLNESKADSAEAFTYFNERNTTFYQDARAHLNQIADSSLREIAEQSVQASLQKYNASVSKHKSILTEIDTNKITLNDLHLMIKISRAMAVMEKYQKSNKPSTKPLEGYLQKVNEAKKYADSLARK